MVGLQQFLSPGYLAQVFHNLDPDGSGMEVRYLR